MDGELFTTGYVGSLTDGTDQDARCVLHGVVLRWLGWAGFGVFPIPL
jgi:hypothetical protein